MFLSDRHGKVVTIPSISIQCVIENVCLKRGEYLLQFSFYTRENELILILSFTDETMDLHQIYSRQICFKTVKTEWKR